MNITVLLNFGWENLVLSNIELYNVTLKYELFPHSI